jgi:hypothetical protein
MVTEGNGIDPPFLKLTPTDTPNSKYLFTVDLIINDLHHQKLLAIVLYNAVQIKKFKFIY